MISADSTNFQSLNIIREELVVTIEQAARDLEVFISDGNDKSSFEACLTSVQQILGVLRMLEFKGASLLTEEVYLVAKEINPDNDTPLLEKQLELVSNAFFVLTRYLEYVQNTDKVIPTLLVSYVNELKKFRGEPPLAESHFFDVNIEAMPSPIDVPNRITVSDTEFGPLLIRLRHMYQVGLLGVLKGRQLKGSLGLILRALNRLHRLEPESPLSALWWVSYVAIDASVKMNMEFIEPRKILLSRLDRIIRQVQKEGRSAYNTEPPKVLIKEFLYLILLSGEDTEAIKDIKASFSVESLTYTDKTLSAERQILQGPSAHTMSSLVRVLRIEIGTIKKVLDTASQGSSIIDDVEGLVGSLAKIAETLGVVGLVGPCSILKQDIEFVKLWSSVTEVADDELQRSAKVLLYVESAVDCLEGTKISAEELVDTSEKSQDQIISSNELATAERIVLTECEAGIALTKRAITSYSESNCDAGHIINIGKTLSTVRGGLLMLSRQRAASVVASCMNFVDEVLLQKVHPPEIKELLETFADAIVSIEYFMDTSGEVHRLDDSVLQVAEESLTALGFSITES